ncbi:hypothetical protein ACFX13_046383 [Malus domestica]
MLSESENLEVVISDTATERLRVSKFFLVGKVFSRKYLRPSIVMGVIKDLWRPKANVEATAIGDNHILFSFNSEEEARLVLKGSPWFFGKSLLLLAEVNKFQVLVDVPLREQCFWVRIYGLPPAFMSRETMEVIGAALGRCVQVYCANDFCFGDYMWIKVAIDVFLLNNWPTFFLVLGRKTPFLVLGRNIGKVFCSLNTRGCWFKGSVSCL